MRARRRTWPHYVRLREALRSYEREALAALDRARERSEGWYSQEVALELLEFLEEEKRKKDDS